MAARGVHFSLTKKMAAKLLRADSDEALMELVEDIESDWDEAHLVESDKAWDAIHRCLTDGQLHYDGGEPPLNRVICGGRQLHQGEDYTISFVSADEVQEVARALVPLDEAWLRTRYFAMLDPREYDGQISEDDFGYT